MKITVSANKNVTFEFENYGDLEEIAGDAPKYFERVSEIVQAGYAVGALTAQQSTATPDVKGKASTPPPADGSAPSCPHGPRKDLLGQTTKDGKPYKFRYYCAAERNDPTKCNPAGVDG